ncbi:hypothetical protein HYT25_02615 [Candidatus Pacearchaeota archaeon]|nr:hypothetical protein [Candidatus Pacearchaeota archaeon]
MGKLTNAVLGAAALISVAGSLSAQENQEKFYDITYRSANGEGSGGGYACLENYAGFQMHCVQLTLSMSIADNLVLDHQGKWYFTRKREQGADRVLISDPDLSPVIEEYETWFWTKESPPGTLYYIPFNKTAQKSFRWEEVRRPDGGFGKLFKSREEFCKGVRNVCRDFKDMKRLPPYKVLTRGQYENKESQNF